MFAVVPDKGNKCCLDLNVGVLPPDWLVNATYLGTDTINVVSLASL